MKDLMESASKITKPISLVALVVLGLYGVYKVLFEKVLLTQLNNEQSFDLINSIVDKIFYLAVTVSILSLALHAASVIRKRKDHPTTQILGHVVFADDSPAAGALVMVRGYGAPVHADRSGFFRVDAPDDEFYMLHVSLGSLHKSITVSRSATKSPVTVLLGSSTQAVPRPAVSDRTRRIDDKGKLLYCSFCGKSQHEVKKLIAGPSVFICDECSDVCLDVLDDEDGDKRVADVTALVQTTLKLASSRLNQAEKTDLQEKAQEIAHRVRSRRRERPGDLVANASLVRVVGNGNFSTVWEGVKVVDERLTDEKLAIKIFDQNKLTTGLMLWRFLRGIRAMQHFTNLGTLTPQAIVPIVSVGSDLLSFSMPYLPGGDLERIRLLGWSMARKLEVFGTIAEAVEFSHRQGVVHRDIKPANVVLDACHNPVLTDFDIADIQFAKTQSVYAGSLGTPQFAAPEQLVGDCLVAAPTADIYSLGKLLYFLVEEQPPPLGSTEPGQVPNWLVNFHPGLRSVVHRAISYSPEQRHSSVGELLSDFRSCVSGSNSTMAEQV